MKAYTEDFYATRHQRTVHSANAVLSILLERIPAIKSAVDVGCGVGTWLSVLKEKGISDIQGIDGDWVDKDVLVIPKESFIQRDLSAQLKLSRRYDLAICLEVAEHLPCECSQELVMSLTEMSELVLFSAAIPLQGGRNHVNEQWQHYWAGLFAARDYIVHDFIRANIWNDDAIPFWYRQNILLFAARGRSAQISCGVVGSTSQPLPIDLVHPKLYMKRAGQMTSVSGSWRALRRSLRSRIRESLGRNGGHRTGAVRRAP